MQGSQGSAFAHRCIGCARQARRETRSSRASHRRGLHDDAELGRGGHHIRGLAHRRHQSRRPSTESRRPRAASPRRRSATHTAASSRSGTSSTRRTTRSSQRLRPRNLATAKLSRVSSPPAATPPPANRAAPRRAPDRRRGAAPDALPGRCRSSGPAFIACVAYIDPGNFATNIAGGSQFGYRLVWVIVASNLMAMLIQTLSAKLGIATRPQPARGLPRAVPAPHLALPLGAGRGDRDGDRPGRVPRRRDRLPPAARDGRSSRRGASPASPRSRSSACSASGFRPLEAVIAALVGVIGVCYLAELGFAHPDYGQVLQHAVDAAVRRHARRCCSRSGSSARP